MTKETLIDLLHYGKFDEAREMIEASDDKEALISATNEYGSNDEGWNALHEAIERKAPYDLILEMIESGGAAVFAKNNTGWTPLHRALRWGVSYKVLKELIAKNPEALDKKDNGGETPRDWLLKYHKLDERSTKLMKKSTEEILKELNLLASKDDKEENLDLVNKLSNMQQQINNLQNELAVLRQPSDKPEKAHDKKDQELEFSKLWSSFEAEKAQRLLVEKQLKDQVNEIVALRKFVETKQQEMSSMKADISNLKVELTAFRMSHKRSKAEDLAQKQDVSFLAGPIKTNRGMNDEENKHCNKEEEFEGRMTNTGDVKDMQEQLTGLREDALALCRLFCLSDKIETTLRKELDLPLEIEKSSFPELNKHDGELKNRIMQLHQGLHALRASCEKCDRSQNKAEEVQQILKEQICLREDFNSLKCFLSRLSDINHKRKILRDASVEEIDLTMNLSNLSKGEQKQDFPRAELEAWSKERDVKLTETIQRSLEVGQSKTIDRVILCLLVGIGMLLTVVFLHLIHLL